MISTSVCVLCNTCTVEYDVVSLIYYFIHYNEVIDMPAHVHIHNNLAEPDKLPIIDF